MRRIGSVASVLAAVLSLALAGTGLAQAGLAVGGSQSNFGRGSLAGRFMPDPFTVAVTSGGTIDASTVSGLPANCRGFVTRTPDYILDYRSPQTFLRFFVVGQGDTTLVVNDGAGRWHCNDDSFGGVNPTVDLTRPSAGQYDIWVGSYRSGENIRGTLHVTELRSQHP